MSITDDTALDLQALNISGNLIATAAGLTDSGSLIIGGTTTLSTGAANIQFDESGNDFGTVIISSANNVAILDADDIDLGASTISGTLGVATTSGAITDSGAVNVTTLRLTILAKLGLTLVPCKLILM